FRYAKPTGSLQALFASDMARGRITFEKDGRSVTLLSQRGLGLQDDTRAIPGIYAQAKEAVSRLKNSAPVLRVKGASREPATPPRPPAGPAGTGPGGNGR